MRVVGLDLGERRIGVAVSDRAGTLAVGHGVVERTADWRPLVAVVEELAADCVVVGFGPLRRLLAVPVELIDERLSTVAATRGLQAAGVRGPARRQVVDQAAAVIILQSWLDRQRARTADATASSGPETESA